MDRKAEYDALLRELDALEPPEGAVERAVRRRRRVVLLRPLATAAAVLALFVALVNFSAPVADACARIPGLRELARAVTFSRSLGDAVENNYVQPVDLTETNGDITVTVEYLIVDQKNVTVFYRIASDRYPALDADPEFAAADGGNLLPAAWWPGGYGTPNGELRSATLSFARDDVPSSLLLRLKLWDAGAREAVTEAPASPVGAAPAEEPWEPEALARFEFLLEFDPRFTAQGRHYAPDAPVTLDGQTLRLRAVDVYPTYLSVTLEGEPENTAWLADLDLWLVSDRGERFDPPTGGIVSSGSPDSPEMVTYRADSAFFYDAESLTLYITGAEWLRKDAEPVRVDLARCAADGLPEGVTLTETRREGADWRITVLKSQADAQAFMKYRDDAGREYEFDTWSSTTVGPDGEAAGEGMIFETVWLRDWPGDEVLLLPRYTERRTADEPVAVEIPLP